MLKKLIKLLIGFINEDKYADTCRGLYIQEKLPKTYGTKITNKGR